MSPKTAKSKCPYPQIYKVLSKDIIYDFKLKTASKGIKLFTQKNIQILIFDVYVQQVKYKAGRAEVVISTRPSNTAASRQTLTKILISDASEVKL